MALGLPNLSPLVIAQAKYEAPSLILDLNDVKLNGIETFKIVEMMWVISLLSLNLYLLWTTYRPDFQKAEGSFKAIVKHASLKGNYNIKGQLILPINGNGPISCTFDDVIFFFKLKWATYEKNNDIYFNITKYHLDYEVGKSIYKLDNLFNGDETLGKFNLFMLKNNFLNNGKRSWNISITCD